MQSEDYRMRYAVIDTLTGMVENVIEAEASFSLPGKLLVEYEPGVGMGWAYIGGAFIAPHVPSPSPEELRESFPTLNPAQIRLGLLSIGITEDMVETALAGDAAALTEWRHRPSYRRTHPLVIALSSPAHFDLPAEQVDALWLWAAEL